MIWWAMLSIWIVGLIGFGIFLLAGVYLLWDALS